VEASPSPEPTLEPTLEPPPQANAPSKQQRALAQVLEWLFLRRALKDAHAAVVADRSEQRRHRRYARVAREVAERARDVALPGAAAASLPSRAELYRESAYWALLSLAPAAADAPTYPELLDSFEPGRLAALAGAPEAERQLRELGTASFASFGALPESEQDRLVRAILHRELGIMAIAAAVVAFLALRALSTSAGL